jgi:serine-type D-Ala-D-Ala carboxypeptidase
VILFFLLLQSIIGFDGATFDPIVQHGIEAGVYPGAAIVIGRHDTILFKRGYGHLTWSRTSPLVDPDSTLYDLASLTKVVATTTSLMLLVDRGKVQLDAPVASYVPEFNGPGTSSVRVRELLTHTSGLRATLPLFRDASDSATAARLVYAATPIVPPGSRVIYSDLNAILLGEIVVRTSGVAQDAFAVR